MRTRVLADVNYVKYQYLEVMASRVIEVGTIVTRTRFLLRSGVLQECPRWLEVVEAFPPLPSRTPESGRPPALSYPEDTLRQEFHNKYQVVADASDYEEVTSLYEDQTKLTVRERFVREQRARLESGEKIEEAAMGALWALRNTGADIRLKQEPVATSAAATVDSADGLVHNLRNLLKAMHHTTQD